MRKERESSNLKSGKKEFPYLHVQCVQPTTSKILTGIFIFFPEIKEVPLSPSTQAIDLTVFKCPFYASSSLNILVSTVFIQYLLFK